MLDTVWRTVTLQCVGLMIFHYAWDTYPKSHKTYYYTFLWELIYERMDTPDHVRVCEIRWTRRTWRRILKNVRRGDLTSPDILCGKSKSRTLKCPANVWYSQHILQWNVQRESKISGKGLAVRRTKFLARLTRILRTLHVKFTSVVSVQLTC